MTLLTVCMLILATGCSSEPEKRIGIIRHMNVTEETFDKFFAQIQSLDSNHEKRRFIFFNNMTDMVAALQAGQIDELATYGVIARYLTEHHPEMEWTPHEPEMADAFCCAMREKDSALKKQFSDVIDEIITDGTLNKLVKYRIFDANHLDPPEAIEMPVFNYDEYDEDYEPPLRIGVTGDLPPLDYIRADGKPAGFNTALLAEISRHLKRNFEIVPIDGGARAEALSSNLVDVIFWVIVPTYDEMPINIDKPDGIILTDPYFTDEIVHVRIKQ